MKKLIWCLIILQFSCSMKETPNYQNLLTVSEPTSQIDAISLVDSLIFIPIESSASTVIGHIDKVLYHSGKLIIGDLEMTEQLFVVTLDGLIESQIDDIGSGPKEYKDIYDFDVYFDTIFLLTSNKLMKYSLSGVLVEEQPIDFYPEYFKVLDNQSYMFYNTNTPLDGHHSYCISIVDRNLNVVEQLMQYDEKDEINQYQLKKPMADWNGRTLISKAFSNSLISPTTKEVIDFDLSSFVKKQEWQQFKSRKELISSTLSSDYLWAIDNVVLSDSLLFFITYRGSSIKPMLFNLANDNCFGINISGEQNIWYGLIQQSGITSINNDILVGFVESGDVELLLDLESARAFYEPRIMVSDSVATSTEANPFIVLANLKVNEQEN